MKKGLSVLWFYSMMSVTVYGQGFVVSADKMNVAYVGVDNPMTIIVEGYECDQLIVSCENGTIVKTGNCEYNFRPVREEAVEITVKVKTTSGTKSFGVKKFRIKYMPSPRATIMGKSSGLIQTAIFKAQLGVSATIESIDFDTRFIATSFKVEFFREQILLYSGPNIGPLFTKTILEQMSKLKPGDRVFITDIKAVGPDSRERTLNNIDLTLN